MWLYCICVRLKNMQIKLRHYNVRNKYCHVVEGLIYKTTIKFSRVIYEILISSCMKVKINPFMAKGCHSLWSGSELGFDNLNSSNWTITVPYIERLWNKVSSVILLCHNIIINLLYDNMHCKLWTFEFAQKNWEFLLNKISV